MQFRRILHVLKEREHVPDLLDAVRREAAFIIAIIKPS